MLASISAAARTSSPSRLAASAHFHPTNWSRYATHAVSQPHSAPLVRPLVPPAPTSTHSPAARPAHTAEVPLPQAESPSSGAGADDVRAHGEPTLGDPAAGTGRGSGRAGGASRRPSSAWNADSMSPAAPASAASRSPRLLNTTCAQRMQGVQQFPQEMKLYGRGYALRYVWFVRQVKQPPAAAWRNTRHDAAVHNVSKARRLLFRAYYALIPHEVCRLLLSLQLRHECGVQQSQTPPSGGAPPGARAACTRSGTRAPGSAPRLRRACAGIAAPAGPPRRCRGPPEGLQGPRTLPGPWTLLPATAHAPAAGAAAPARRAACVAPAAPPQSARSHHAPPGSARPNSLRSCAHELRAPTWLPGRRRRHEQCCTPSDLQASLFQHWSSA